MNMTAERRLFLCGFASFLRSAPCCSGNYAEVASGFIALGNLACLEQSAGNRILLDAGSLQGYGNLIRR